MCLCCVEFHPKNLETQLMGKREGKQHINKSGLISQIQAVKESVIYCVYHLLGYLQEYRSRSIIIHKNIEDCVEVPSYRNLFNFIRINSFLIQYGIELCYHMREIFEKQPFLTCLIHILPPMLQYYKAGVYEVNENLGSQGVNTIRGSITSS